MKNGAAQSKAFWSGLFIVGIFGRVNKISFFAYQSRN